MFTKTKSSIFSKIAIAIVLVTAIIVGFFFIQKSLAQSQAVAPAITNYIRDFNAKVGKADSNVKVIYLFDFSCSACQANAENISKIVADTKDKVQFVFKPFITHPGSGNRNANAAYAANLQGKYFEYEEKLIQINKGKNGNATDKDHEQLAEQLGMDLVKFNKDKNSKETENDRQPSPKTGAVSLRCGVGKRGHQNIIETQARQHP